MQIRAYVDISKVSLSYHSDSGEKGQVSPSKLTVSAHRTSAELVKMLSHLLPQMLGHIFTLFTAVSSQFNKDFTL